MNSASYLRNLLADGWAVRFIASKSEMWGFTRGLVRWCPPLFELRLPENGGRFRLKHWSDVLRMLGPGDLTFVPVARMLPDAACNRLATMAGKAGEAAKHPVSLGVASVEAISQGYEHGGLRGAAVGVSLAATAYLANTLRSAGIKRTSDLYREMLADPEKARAFLQKMPAAAESGALHNVARVMKRSLVVWPIVGPGKPA